MEENIMHLTVCFDRNYIVPFYVLLTSVFSSNEGENFHFHVVATDLAVSEKAALDAYVGTHASKIFFYEIGSEVTEGLLIPEGSYFTIATYYRLFVPALVPTSVRNLLYLDTDTNVVGSLAEVCRMDLGSEPIAAVLDGGMRDRRADLGVAPADYFNAGVMLINRAKWNADRLTEQAITFARNFPGRVPYVDQDALNAVVKGNWRRLPMRYNVTMVDVPAGSRREMHAFVRDKRIIHFTGVKPWHYRCRNLLRYVYHHYHQKSPYAKQNVYSDFSLDFRALSELAKVNAMEAYFEYPAIGRGWRRIKRNMTR